MKTCFVLSRGELDTDLEIDLELDLALITIHNHTLFLGNCLLTVRNVKTVYRS